MAGFKSPAFWLGLGSAPVVTQGGFRTPMPFWNAGGTEDTPEVVVRRLGGWIYEGRRRKRWKDKKREEERKLLEALERIYERVTGEAPDEVIEVVAPYTKGNKPRTRPPAPRRVDFEAMSRNLRAVEKLVEIARQAQTDEAVAILLLS